jgi:hypothetical protein
MTTKYFLFLAVLIAVTTTVEAQVTGYGLGDFYNSALGSKYGKISGPDSGIKGSPYEQEQFIPGTIYTTEQQCYKEIPLRFNIFSGQMEFQKVPGENYEIDHPEKIDSILIGEDKYIYTSFQSNSKPQKGYLKVLSEGLPSLLVSMKVSFRKAEPPGLYKDPVPAGFERAQDQFCLLFPGREALPFSGKKELFEILGSFQNELDQYIKENKIRFNKQGDLIRLMYFYYSLKP